MDIKTLLIEALKLSKKQEVSSRNTALPKELGAILSKHFKSKELLQEVQSILKTKREVPETLLKDSNWEDWQGPGHSSKKKKNVAKDLIVEAVVDNTTDDENDHEDFAFEELVSLNDQQLLDKFGTLSKIRAYSKEMGLDANKSLDPKDYLQAFRDQLSSVLGSDTVDLTEEE